MKYYLLALKKYAVFKGRSNREEYWYFMLFYLLIGIGIYLIEVFLLGIDIENDERTLVNIYRFVTFLPTIAVGVRRMHDINKSGWFILIPFYNIFLATLEGTKGENQYGADPQVKK